MPRSSTSLRRKGVPPQTVLVHTSRPTLGVLGLMLGRIPVERRRIPTVRTRSEPFRNQANSSPGHLTVEARTVTITIAVMYSSSTWLPRRAQATEEWAASTKMGHRTCMSGVAFSLASTSVSLKHPLTDFSRMWVTMMATCGFGADTIG